MRDGGWRSSALQNRAKQHHRDEDGALAEVVGREEGVLVLAIETRAERAVGGIEQNRVVDQPDRPEASTTPSLRNLAWRDIRFWRGQVRLWRDIGADRQPSQWYAHERPEGVVVRLRRDAVLAGGEDLAGVAHVRIRAHDLADLHRR